IARTCYPIPLDVVIIPIMQVLAIHGINNDRPHRDICSHGYPPPNWIERRAVILEVLAKPVGIKHRTVVDHMRARFEADCPVEVKVVPGIQSGPEELAMAIAISAPHAGSKPKLGVVSFNVAV